MNRIKFKILILSLSVLILLILISSVGSNKTSDPNRKTFASVISESFDRVGSFFDAKFEAIAERSRERKAEREAKKEAKQLLLQQQENKQDDDFYKENISSIPENSEIPMPNNNTEENDNGEISGDVAEPYQEAIEISVPERMKLPETIGKVSFRKMYDYVYACSNAPLYTSPSFEERARASKLWEQFLRTGISEDCCYQLVSESGEVLYADGSHFRRKREDMPFEETITMPGEKVELPVNYISQFPSLPNGCEITSLATVLNYLGYEVSKDELWKEYLPCEKVGKANFYYQFVGEPDNRNSYGCYAPALVEAADKFFEDNGDEYKAVDLTGSSFESLLYKVKEGKPVILWGAAYIESEPSYSTEWIVDGEYLVWKTNMHCMVLIGYDSSVGTVTVSDPMRGITEYDMKLFIKRYKQFYSQAIVLEPTTEREDRQN